MNQKAGIEVLHTEKELYRIFKDLERYGRASFSYPDLSKHRGMARSIGIRVKPFVERNLILPPLSSTNRHRMTGVMLPVNVKVEGVKRNNGTFFRFNRI